MYNLFLMNANKLKSKKAEFEINSAFFISKANTGNIIMKIK